ncbi:PREDICTED: transmembrane protein 64-like [Ipomoea nil]|uniref:transmembrane protein 64-like n=1 Tax=Ipomoea nil TaxID=35883 RepID=UPI000900F5C0|nr:PREDICTED: transmembrane protein 64-like [Ipomoea nil]
MMTFAAGEGAAAAKSPGPGEDRDEAYYVKLRNDELEESSGDCIGGDGSTSSQAAEAVVAVGCEVGGRWWSFWWWAKLLLLLIFLGVLAAVFLIWVGPFFMDKEIIPILNWEMKTFSPPVLAVFVFGSVALFPTFLLPSTPSMWVAGMTFGYGYGFLLIIGGAAIGVSLPYFIGYLFRRRIQVCLERYPKNASMIRLAGEGDCLNQFQAVALIRVSPFPYIVYNYCAMATGVKYFPYLLGSLVGMVPEIFVAIYTGILIKTLANASHDQHSLSAPQIIFTVSGFCLTVVTTVLITVYAKRRLKQLQADDELLLQ